MAVTSATSSPSTNTTSITTDEPRREPKTTKSADPASGPNASTDGAATTDGPDRRRTQLTWEDTVATRPLAYQSGVVPSAPAIGATPARARMNDPRFSTDGDVITVRRTNGAPDLDPGQGGVRFTQADAERAIAEKTDPARGMMDPTLAGELQHMTASPVWQGATPPGSPNGPVWFRSYNLDPHGDPNVPDAQVYSYQRGNELATFEVAGSFARAYATIDPSGGGTNSALGLPTSGRETLRPGTPEYDQLARYYQPGAPLQYQNFENGRLLQTSPGDASHPARFTWVTNDGRPVRTNVAVPYVDLSKAQNPFGVNVPANAKNAELREYWGGWVRDNVAPQLRAAGVSDAKIERVIKWGLSEGIYTIGNNPEYGQADGSRQSPLTFTNFKDSNRHPEWTKDTNVNGITSAPNPWDWTTRVRSGDFQVGIAGIQVTDAIGSGSMKRAFDTLYAGQSPQAIGQRILDQMGEKGATFPPLSMAELAEKENMKWAAVLLHDPAMNVLIQTWNPNLP